MTTCQSVYQFLSQIGARNITTPLADPDLALLKQYGIVQLVSPDMYHNLESNVAALDTAQQALNQETAERVGLAINVQDENQRTHSVLFHFESKDKQAAAVQKEQQDEARLHSLDDDLAKKQQDFAQLVAQRSRGASPLIGETSSSIISGDCDHGACTFTTMARHRR